MSSRVGALWLSAAAVADLQYHAIELYPRETGGVLMGYEAAGDTVVVTVIGPGPSAHHSSTSYMPDHEYHDGEVARVYEASGRRITYLGDWHTHPKGRLYLSNIDMLTLRRIQ
jgi:integrative and conjugative element protein (TIGR02256 family)